jgi:LmbE family N-acetylglucosaminyl deacetylase
MMLTAKQAMTAIENLSIVAADQLVTRGLLVIAPHPDDESLGCGGLIAASRARKIPVHIVIVSDGVGSHPNSSLYPAVRLRVLREQEVIAAGYELGVTEDAITFLRLPDRFVRSDGSGAQAAVNAIVRIAQTCNADLMTVTWEHDPHCDHQAAFALARAAHIHLAQTRLCAYPIWGFKLPPDQPLHMDYPEGSRVWIREYLPAKRSAVAAHSSQVTRLIDDDPLGFILGADDLARFDRPYEPYLSVVG